MIFSGIFQLRGKDMSDFNKIMAFQQMMPYLNKEQQDNLATTLGMELQKIERRLVGKNKEEFFFLWKCVKVLLHLMRGYLNY